MPEIYVSTSVLPGNTLAEVLSTADRWGIRNIELSAGLKHEPDMAQQVLQARDRFSFLVHNYFPPPKEDFLLNLASGSSEIRERSLALGSDAIALCRRIGAPFYSFHCGFAFDSDGSHMGTVSQLDLPRIGLDQAMVYFLDSLKQLVSVAEKNDMNLAMENNVLARFGLIDGKNQSCLGADVESLSTIFDQVGSDRLKLLLDIGHAKVNATTLRVDMAQLIRRFNNRILAVHISDNDGLNDQNLPLADGSSMIPLLRQINAPWIIESYHETKDSLNAQVRLLRSIMPVER